MKSTTKSSLRNDQDFFDFFDYTENFLNEELLTISDLTEELHNEEKLALKSILEENEVGEKVRDLPASIQKPFGKLAEMINKNFKKKSLGKNPKNKIMIQSKTGKLIDFETFSKEENWEFYLKIKKSKIPNIQKGLFTTRDFYIGEFIAPYYGDILTENEVFKKYGNEKNPFIVKLEIPNNDLKYIAFIDANNYKDSIARYGKYFLL